MKKTIIALVLSLSFLNTSVYGMEKKAPKAENLTPEEIFERIYPCIIDEETALNATVNVKPFQPALQPLLHTWQVNYARAANNKKFSESDILAEIKLWTRITVEQPSNPIYTSPLHKETNSDRNSYQFREFFMKLASTIYVASDAIAFYKTYDVIRQNEDIIDQILERKESSHSAPEGGEKEEKTFRFQKTNVWEVLTKGYPKLNASANVAEFLNHLSLDFNEGVYVVEQSHDIRLSPQSTREKDSTDENIDGLSILKLIKKRFPGKKIESNNPRLLDNLKESMFRTENDTVMINFASITHKPIEPKTEKEANKKQAPLENTSNTNNTAKNSSKFTPNSFACGALTTLGIVGICYIPKLYHWFRS